MRRAKENLESTKIKSEYSKFESLDGRHPLQNRCPDSFVPYKARSRKGGKVAFLNFDLAIEMGLIPKNHPRELNPELEKKILDTFSIVIINEYDIIHKTRFPEEDIRPHEYMATRYLQLQHPNKQGKTSGDGRSVWNGQVTHQGVTWDVSSCGTGATSLSPATHLKGKFFKTGDPTISYGCGYSEIDEGFSTLFFSEVFNRNKVRTERVLAIIEFPKNIAITVRAHENLIRPSHFFNHLKQGHYDGLRAITDFYIDRQIQNGEWKNVPENRPGRYRYFLDRISETFSKTAAYFEDEYVFCWLDWDGDNILMDGGIIDYGSIRQFGLFHHEYRYDDVQRYSTTILEQKQKARYIVQSFVQAIDFLMTKKKKKILKFRRHPVLRAFDRDFKDWKLKNLLHKIGFNPEHVNLIFDNRKKKIENFRKDFDYFEMAKSKKGIQKVADGINWNAIYCMRDILRELPQILLSRGQFIENEEFIEIIRSHYATDADVKGGRYRDEKIQSFQKNYLGLIDWIAEQKKTERNKVLLEISMRSSVINKYDRVTGDSITTIVDKVLKHKPRLNPVEVYQVMKEFSEYQNLDPDSRTKTTERSLDKSPLIKGMLKVVREYREGL